MFKVLVSVIIRGYELLTLKNHLSSTSAMQIDITKHNLPVYMLFLLFLLYNWTVRIWEHYHHF